MPQRTGKGRIERLRARNSDFKVLFASGNTDDAVARHGVLESRRAFLSKPFSGATLARKVRDQFGAPLQTLQYLLQSQLPTATSFF